MPHIHLETTPNITENSSIPRILSALVDQLAEFETIESSSIKAYHTIRDSYCMGNGARPGFIHCTVQILTGRSEELRGRMADALFQHLQVRFQDSLAKGLTEVSLEIREMDRETFRR